MLDFQVQPRLPDEAHLKQLVQQLFCFGSDANAPTHYSFERGVLFAVICLQATVRQTACLWAMRLHTTTTDLAYRSLR